MSKKTKKAKAKYVPGERFEGTKKLLAQYGVKTRKDISNTVCNMLGCDRKLKDKRRRWCDEHATLTKKVRMLDIGYRRHGHSVKSRPEGQFHVRGGHLTLQAVLDGINEKKALAEYKASRPAAPKVSKEQKTAAKRKAAGLKRSAAAAERKVKAVKAAPKKVPVKPSLSALRNGKGAEVQAAVAAHVAAKAAQTPT